MSVRAREPAAEGVAATAARLETVLRVGHDFQERPDPTGPPFKPAQNRAYSNSKPAQRGKSDVPVIKITEEAKPPPPKPGTEVAPALLKIADMAQRTGLNPAELRADATLLLACMNPGEPAFLEALFSGLDFYAMSDDDIASLETEVAKFAASKDRWNILGDAPTLMESVYFFTDTILLLSIRHLEDPCAVQDTLMRYDEDVRARVFDQAAKIQMIASTAYPGNDSLMHWKRDQTRFFASARLPGLDKDFEKAEAVPSLVGPGSAPTTTMATEGAAFNQVRTAVGSVVNVRNVVGLWVAVLTVKALSDAPETIHEISRGYNRTACLQKPTDCRELIQSEDDFVASIFEPYINLAPSMMLCTGFCTPFKQEVLLQPWMKGHKETQLERFKENYLDREQRAGIEYYRKQMTINLAINLSTVAVLIWLVYSERLGALELLYDFIADLVSGRRDDGVAQKAQGRVPRELRNLGPPQPRRNPSRGR